MARRLVFVLALGAAICIPIAAQSFSFNTGDASLDVTLNSINVQAQANIGPYTADLSATFGVGQPQIQVWLTQEKLQPAEVYLVLEMGRIVSQPPATVIAAYKKNKGKGWGAVARALGIKPGSAEFKALKGSAEDRDRKGKGGKKK
jgi:hypothetical protein